MTQDLTALNEEFRIEDRLIFDAGEGGLTRAVIDTPACTGAVYLHGAHVTAWCPRHSDEVLWLSGASAYRDGKAIRGGVPVCFPWFGPKAGDPDAPSHGLVRTRAWRVIATKADEEKVHITFQTEATHWRVQLTASFGTTLTIALDVTNIGGDEALFEAALHSYFSVGDIRHVTITGLDDHVEYLDKMDGGARKEQDEEPIRFTGETDRVYVDTEHSIDLEDPKLDRRIVVSKSGSESTVVWNPWIDKAARMPDFGDDEWPGMCCIETANVARNAVVLAPDTSHRMSATIGVEPR